MPYISTKGLLLMMLQQKLYLILDQQGGLLINSKQPPLGVLQLLHSGF